MNTTLPTDPPERDTYRGEIGADGCGCPITAELTTANGSEVEGTQRTEHRSKCWAAEPTGYAVTAAELRRIADALDTLPPVDKPPFVQLSILPDEKTVEAVDAVAMAVLGEPGKTRRDSDGWRHIIQGGPVGKVSVSIHALVPGPPDPRDAELERLRAEVAKLKAATDSTGAVFDREPEELKPTSAVPANVEGHAEFTGRASVPDMQTRPTLCSAEVRPGIACGVPIRWNAVAHAWWHQSVLSFRHTATGPSVPPQNGGE